MAQKNILCACACACVCVCTCIHARTEKYRFYCLQKRLFNFTFFF